MGGATRFVTLLTAPFPRLRPSLHLLRHGFSSLTITSHRGWNLYTRSEFNSFPRFVNSFHSQSSSNAYALNSTAASQQQHHHPWPEWIHFLNVLSSGHVLSTPVPGELKILPDDAFVEYEELPNDFVLASSKCLAFGRSRPNLLGLLSRKNVEAVVVNGTPFLFKSAIECSRRMRAFLESNGSNVAEFDGATTVDLMKYLISYASNPTVASGKSGLFSRELVDSSARQLLHELSLVISAPTGYTHASEHQFSGRYGQTPRPLGRNIEMKRGDWVCSKCNFMNFARNMKCLECEETRPKRLLTGGEWDCPQCNFFNYGKNMVCLRCDCRRPGAPSFTPVNSRSSSGYTEESNMPVDRLPFGGNPSETNPVLDPSISPSMNHDYGRSATIPESNLNSGSDYPSYSRQKSSSSVPFVPLPANLFAKREGSSEFDHKKELPAKAMETASSEIRNQANVSSETQSTDKNFQFQKKPSSQEEIKSEEKTQQAEKSESWFKKVMELHDSNDPSSDDFPEIMPMRKGDNQFVVGKMKDRSLTSPKYKRQVAMDQASNANFVQFVPFPPGYFARKETEQPNQLGSSETEKSLGSKQIMAGSSAVPTADMEAVGSKYSEHSRLHDVPPTGSSAVPTTELVANEFSRLHDVPPTASVGAESQVPENKDVRISWTGKKSLEGSGVGELPDPLDMSEEAKAERWFKRVAQIKDISELSQIPDEDFPSIMPMRKGVNRFVVSKRKTPLERRLASQQYRRNLPTVSNDSVKKESDSS